MLFCPPPLPAIYIPRCCRDTSRHFTGVCDVLVNKCSLLVLVVKSIIFCSSPFHVALLFPLPGMVMTVIQFHFIWSPSVVKATVLLWCTQDYLALLFVLHTIRSLSYYNFSENNFFSIFLLFLSSTHLSIPPKFAN